jgi:hypothetical protein
MTERPILFSGPLVRAILEGRKTETRRLITKGTSRMLARTRAAWDGLAWREAKLNRLTSGHDVGLLVPGSDTMTHGVSAMIRSGDTLYVRESWRTSAAWDEAKPSKLPATAPIIYAADEPLESWMGKLRPSIFMPRWASRIILRVTDVCAERVQEITGTGARAEGVLLPNPGRTVVMPRYAIDDLYVGTFEDLWDSINGKRDGATWADNPWVWVIKFEVAEVKR